MSFELDDLLMECTNKILEKPQNNEDVKNELIRQIISYAVKESLPLLDFTDKTDNDMHEEIYDDIWKDYDKLPFDNVEELTPILQDRIDAASDRIYEYLVNKLQWSW